MKAMIYERYGTPDVLQLRDVAKPSVTDDGVLVRVRAASVNPYDWHYLTGVPYLARTQAGWRRPKTGRLGVDFAGVVECVGKEVTHVRPGDEVYGGRLGAFAEYVVARKAVARKPANLTFEEAAAVPMAAITALQALRRAGLDAGQKVLVNGASGGIGTFAVQLAKAADAEVTAVCSTRNVEAARSLGADRVIDYTQDDFTRTAGPHDLMLDVAGNRSWFECKRVLTTNGTLVIVGGPKTNRLWGPLGRSFARRLLNVGGDRRVIAPFLANLDRCELESLRELIEDGRVKPVVERQYPLSDTPDALRYVGQGHARAKNVISVS